MRVFTVNLKEKADESGFVPRLKLNLLDGNSLRPMVIIVPGGGYTKVSDDGDKTAVQFSSAGFHTAILNYSVLPYKFPLPQYDLAVAIKTIRENAREWKVHPKRIAVCGFSAGGHLCGSLSTLWNNPALFSEEEIRAELHKPDACILYSAILTTRLGHCRAFLSDHVGGNKEKLDLASCDMQANVKTPPSFLYGTYDDKLTNVENMLYYSEKLSEHEVPFELHIFTKGGHCASWCDEVTWAKPLAGRNYNTIKLSIEWLIELFKL